MKQKILELLKERREINITDFHTFIPESKGEYSIYMSVKPDINPNILWMAGVTQDFIKAFNELLIDEKLIDWKPVDIMCYMFDGSPIYNTKLCEKKYLKKQTECWLPIAITLKQ
jgi:hypothetical protein